MDRARCTRSAIRKLTVKESYAQKISQRSKKQKYGHCRISEYSKPHSGSSFIITYIILSCFAEIKWNGRLRCM